MKTYRIRVDGKVYEMDIALIREEVCVKTESGIAVGERMKYSMKTESERGPQGPKDAQKAPGNRSKG